MRRQEGSPSWLPEANQHGSAASFCTGCTSQRHNAPHKQSNLAGVLYLFSSASNICMQVRWVMESTSRGLWLMGLSMPEHLGPGRPVLNTEALRPVVPYDLLGRSVPIPVLQIGKRSTWSCVPASHRLPFSWYRSKTPATVANARVEATSSQDRP